MSVVLPTPENNSGPNDWSDCYSNDAALAAYVETLQKEVAARTGFTWYTPKVIATEQSRENTAFGVLSTADEIKEVVLPENGLIAIGYMAKVKSSVSAAGRAAVFVGSNQLKAIKVGEPVEQEAATIGTNLTQLSTTGHGLENGGEEGLTAADVTTGQVVGVGSKGGIAYVFAAAGTYAISIKYKATSGSVTAKERKLWCCVLG